VQVVHTAVVRDVAYHAALSLIELMRRVVWDKRKDVVHVGFVGGHSMRNLARELARLLEEPREGLPSTIVFHAMAAGIDPADPTTDPNGFFSTIAGASLAGIRPQFVGLSAPLMVKASDVESLRELPEIQDAIAAVKDIDVVVTSGTEWRDPHNALYSRMRRSQRTISILEEAGCVGDVLWRPLSDQGPIEDETSIRALTLLELKDLQGLIRQGKHVLLMFGPCGACQQPKGRLLRAVMNLRVPIASDLVVDSRTAREALGWGQGDPRPAPGMAG
jgi:DNA-binding transcriptional regulator LsrR (DeoR family)